MITVITKKQQVIWQQRRGFSNEPPSLLQMYLGFVAYDFGAGTQLR
jgi:hypothetical protein